VTALGADLIVSFRDADEPRPLAARLIASAHRHARGWTVNVPHNGRYECLTFDAAAQAVANTTGKHHLLIIWTVREGI
jgi:hypothetical protein